MDEQTARRLHQDSLVIDSHNDSIVGLIRRGMSIDGAQRTDQRGHCRGALRGGH